MLNYTERKTSITRSRPTDPEKQENMLRAQRENFLIFTLKGRGFPCFTKDHLSPTVRQMLKAIEDTQQAVINQVKYEQQLRRITKKVRRGK